MAHILLVDDDVAMLEFVKGSLQNAGFTVTSMTNGDDAYAFLSTSPDIDLLLTDIVMNGMDGLALAEKAKKMAPDLKIMFMTGFTAMAPAERVGGAQVMAKPLHLKDLVAHVHLQLQAMA
ncbi:MAG: response regulator [Alphaproteobacteria bacterium]|nr:response regulator [Alphaproteobacteria bacterium]NCQ89195.1 response regulator [Alphaproteobacteria bacterium]NCT08129.1 response regulator [Alphaproteobacteria bacterium]